MRSWPLLVLVAAAGCCSAPAGPFPAVGPLDDAGVVRVLRERTAPLKSVYGVLSLTYEGPGRDGTFSAVMNHEAPRTYRVTAFKDLIVTAHDIFDLLLAPPSYAVLYADDDEDEASLRRGPLEQLPEDHPRFSGFLWAGEAFFLPGSLADDPAPVVERADGLAVRSRLRTGVPVTWHLDPETLRVERATLEPAADHQVTMDYYDYRKIGARFLPTRLRYRDPRLGSDIVAEADDLELEPEFEPDVFVLEEE